MSSIPEISLEGALERLLTDSRIADVELEGCDGVRIPGCRGLLAARSIVLERMLWGHFTESNDSVVKIGYPGEVLKKVVRYCYTNQIDLSEEGEMEAEQKHCIHELLTLADAANYLGLSQLRKRTIDRVKELLHQDPGASFCFLEEAKCVGCDEVLQEALTTIEMHLGTLVRESGDSIRQLSPPSLLDVLKSEYSMCKERLLFQLLELWIATPEDQEKVDRHKVARDQLSKHIRLELIPASILERHVFPSGLVEEKAIFGAYKEQAKSAEKNMDLLQSRSARRWKGTKSVIFQHESDGETVDFLQSDRLTSGCHQWIIEVETCTENMFLGVEGDTHDFWMGYNGVRWRDKTHYGTGSFGFGRKSIVTMTLNLSCSGGSLTVSVNDSKTETLFNQMLSVDDASFVPAVCIKKPGSVRFVGIRRLH